MFVLTLIPQNASNFDFTTAPSDVNIPFKTLREQKELQYCDGLEPKVF